LHEKGICHRDLKPENLLLSNTSADAVVKVADFGFAANCKVNPDMTALVGTPPYMACELVFLRHQEDGGYSIQVDMWSLGVILYILISGIHPFQLDDEEEMLCNIENAQWGWVGDAWKSISKEAKDLVSRLLEPDPTKRLTAKQALEHPWLSINVEDKIDTEELRKFQARRKFKGAVRAVAALNRMKLTLKAPGLLKAIRQSPAEKFYSIKELQSVPLPEGVLEKQRERHLSEDDFQIVFGMDRASFYKLPGWQQVQHKKEHGLA
jgi:serine/threonine protein kinase